MMMAWVAYGQGPPPPLSPFPPGERIPPLAQVKKAKRLKKIPADSLETLFARSLQQIDQAKARGDSSLWEEMLLFQRWYHWENRDWAKAKAIRKELVQLQIARGYVLNR